MVVHQKPPASLQSPADAGPHDLKEKLYSAARPTSQQKDSFQFQHCAKLYQSFFLCWFRGNTGNFLVMKTYLLSRSLLFYIYITPIVEKISVVFCGFWFIHIHAAYSSKAACSTNAELTYLIDFYA